MQDYPDVLNQKINVRSADIVFQPFAGWDGTRAKQSLPWWMAFDNIKHSRAVNKRDANQKNTLYLLGALYLLEMKYLKDITEKSGGRDIPDKESNLFTLDGWETKYSSMRGIYFKRV